MKNSSDRTFIGCLAGGYYIWFELLWIFSLSFTLRLIFIIQYPLLYDFDAYVYLLGLFSEYPLFTGFIKGLIVLDFSVFKIRVITAAVAAFAAIFFYLFTRKVFTSIRFSRLVTLLMMTFPPFFIFSTVPYTEPFFFLFLFLGVWLFETADVFSNRRFAFSGICLGMACLTRYEGVLILPLLLARSVWHRREQLQGKAGLFRSLAICLLFFWGPLVLVLYKYIFLPDLTAFQGKIIQSFLRELFPFLKDFFYVLLPGVVKKMQDNFPGGILILLSVCGLSTIVSFFCVIFFEGKKHIVYILYLFLAGFIQFLPVYTLYTNSQGREFSLPLNRLGMASGIFLLLYVWYGLDLLFQKTVFSFLRRRHALLMVMAVAFLVCALFVETSSIKSARFQRDQTDSCIVPHWIGSPEDREENAGLITLLPLEIFNVRLKGTGLDIYEPEKFPFLNRDEMGAYINVRNVKYILFSPELTPGGDLLKEKIKAMKFKKLASFREIAVYMREKR